MACAHRDDSDQTAYLRQTAHLRCLIRAFAVHYKDSLKCIDYIEQQRSESADQIAVNT